jgi:hypothetical protein
MLKRITNLTLVMALVLGLAGIAEAGLIHYVDSEDSQSSHTDFTNWTDGRRTGFGNGGEIWEDENNIKGAQVTVTISGLQQGATYEMYTYFWDAEGGNYWRIQTWLPGNTPQVYTAVDDSTSDYVSGTVSAPRAVAADFVGAVMVSESDRRMYQVALGQAVADANGKIQLYVEPVTRTGDTVRYRTWYDGVGYTGILVADIGGPYEVLGGDSLQLNSTVTGGGGSPIYAWTINGMGFVGADTANPVLTWDYMVNTLELDINTPLTVSLTVSDGVDWTVANETTQLFLNQPVSEPATLGLLGLALLGLRKRRS